MEVHKHPHHITHKKKWTEYLLEFFMLFLAVFCGFLAENYREHEVERHREVEYIISLVQDLKQDSSRFKAVIEWNSRILKKIDTSFVLLNKTCITDSISKMLYAFHISNPHFATFIFNQRTITQLKSAGGFRLIIKQSASDSIVRYNDIVENAAWIRLELLAALKDDRGSGYSIFNDFLINGLENDSLVLTSNRKFPLMTNDKAILIPYANKLKMRHDWLATYNGLIKVQQGKCKRLIAFLQKEYLLKN